MDRYDTFSRDLRPITGLPSSSDIPPLRDYPQKCDPRRERSYRNVQDIQRSREDQPLIDLATDPYRVRRIVVSRARLQHALPKRVPNARDPRGVQACRRDSIRRRETQHWLPTLVENDGVPLEEETCAVLVVDASEWESKGVKSCYIDVVPHECNVQRALSEAEIKLAQIDDGLLMSAEEAEKRMQPSGARAPQLDDSDAASNSGTLELTDSDVQECDSDGEVVAGRARQGHAPAPGFEAVEDRPMLEVGAGPDVSALRDGVSSPRPVDDDDDENRVIYDDDDEEPPLPPVPRPDDAEVECVDLDADEVVVPKKEPGAPPTPGTDEAHVCIDLEGDEVVVPKKEPEAPPAPGTDDAYMCIDLDDDDDDDDDDEEVIVPKQEPQPPPAPKPNDADIPYIDLELDDLHLDAGNVKQEPQDAYAPYAKTVQREVLGVVTLDDSDEFEEDFLSSLDDSSIPKGNPESNKPESGDDLSMTPSCSALSIAPDAGTKDLLDNPSVVRSDEKNGEGQDHGESVTPSNDIGEGQRNSDCDSASAYGSDLILDSVISRFRAAENNRDAQAREQSVESVGFGAASPETSDSADKADCSGDGDSEVPTTVTRAETVAEVHVPATCDHEDDHSEIADAPAENEEAAAQLANSPTIARKARRKKRKRLDTAADTGNAGAPIAETKRRKENDDDVAVNDENDNGNVAVVERAPSPVFKKLSKKRTKSRWTPSENVLQLSTVSTRAISKPSARVHRTICFSNFYALGNFHAIGDLQKYLKNYTATYNSIEFFCKNFQKLSVFEFLRVNEYVKNNIVFWQNRNNHWQQKDNNVSIEDVTDKGSFNQLLAITDSPSAFRNNQVASLHEVIQPGEHEAVIASTSATWNQQSLSIEKDVTNSTKSSWYAQESNAKDADGKAKLQRRHSLPMVIVPQQNLGAKRPRSCSQDNPIILTLKRSQVNDDSWVASSDTSTLQNITAQCTLSISKDVAQNVQNVISANQSLKANNVCTLNKKRLPKWSCIDKEVPELDIDDFANRPLPQKTHFDERKLSITLQCRVKRRSTSIDSAIASDFDDCTNKRRKLTDSTKEYDSSMDNIFNDCNDRLSLSDYAREPLEITELSPDMCMELSRPSSVNICNLNSSNTANTCENSGNWKSCNLEDSSKSCSTNAVVLNQECLNLDGSNTPYLENDNHDLSNDNASSSSGSSFHLCIEDEPEEPSIGESHESNIQIDYNCNLQKDCGIMSSIDQEESNLTVDSRKQEKSNCSETFTRDVNKLNKSFQLLFGESDLDEAKRLIAVKSNVKVHQISETVNTSIELRLHPIDENQLTGNAEEGTCAKKSQVFASSFTKSGSISTNTNNEGQEHQTSNNTDSNIYTILEKSTNIENHLDRSEVSAPTKTHLEYQNKITINGVSITPDGQNDSLKNVDQDKASLDVLSSQAFVNNKQQNQVESEDALESETSLPIDKQSLVIFNEEVDSDVPHCNINDNTSGQVFQNQNDKNERVHEHREKDGVLPGSQETNHINTSTSLLHQDEVLPETDDEHALGEKINVVNDMSPEHSPSKDERNEDLIGNQETNNINTSTSLLHQDQVLPETDDEHSSGNTINVASDVAPEHSPFKDKRVMEQENQGRNEDLIGNQETNHINTSTSLLYQAQILPETVNLEEGFEEGDFEFLPTIQGIKTNTESDDEYDIHSDCDEFDNQTNVNYSRDIKIQKINESLINNESADVSNCEMNSERTCPSSGIEDEQVSANSEDENLHSLQNSPSNIRNVDTAKSNSTDIGEEDDDIIIEYENISNCSLAKDIKPDISNINHDSNMQVSEFSNLHISSLDIHQERSLDCQSEIQKIGIPTPLPGSSLHNNDFTIEKDQLQMDTSTENINSLDQSRLEIPVPDTNLVHPMADNSEVLAMKTSASNGINNEILDVNTSIGSPLAPELVIQSSKNITVNLNNLNILQKFNLTKEIIAPEDTNTDNSTTFENNVEEQILSDTLKIFENEISIDSSEKDHDNSTVIDKQNYSNKDIETTTLPITIEFKLPTNKTRSDNDLLKALNINVDNEVDIITPELLDKISTKQASPGVIKVKNLNDMLQKPHTVSKENVSSNQNVPMNQNVSLNQSVSSGIPLPDVAQSNQQSINHGVENLQSQPNIPVNVFPPNNTLRNAYVIQPAPYTYIVNQPTGPLQPIMNMCNIVPVPMPTMNSIGQPMPVSNTSSLSQAPAQDNSPTLPQGVPSSERKMVLASSMFPGMFDSHPTSSFCSKTVFTLQLPPLANIILPPPYTILPTYDQATISQKIEAYKWALLEKLISILTELENMDVNIIKRNLEILFRAQTLTEETWYFQEKLLIVAQCVGSLQKLTTDKKYINIIEAIVGTIYNRVRDLNLLKKILGIFLKLKESGIYKNFAAEQQPLTLELGDLLIQSAIGMSSGQKEVLKYQVKIYQEIFKINNSSLQSNRISPPSNQTKKQAAVQRSSPIAIQQNIVTTTVSSPVTETANSSLQNLVMQKQSGREKPCLSVKQGSKDSTNKCDNISMSCIKCGKKSQILCSRCKIATYCSRDCQMKHWKVEHSANCNYVKT